MVRPSPSPSTKRHRTKRTSKKSRIKIIFFFLLLIFIIMASNNDSPPRFLLPPHIIPPHVLPTHRLWPLPQPTQGCYPKETDNYSRPYGPPPAQENGRQYQSFRREIYPFPCDQAERDRLEQLHKVFLLARDFILHARPLPHLEYGQRVRVLDLGTGTGAWAIQMAELYPLAEVVGVDLVNIQPPMTPRNLRFQVPFDYGSHWFVGEEMPWDLIHLRGSLGSVSNWTKLYKNIFRRLKPDGVLEQVEIDLEPHWDNGKRIPPNHPLKRWFDTVLYATTQAGRSIGWRHDTLHMLRSQGFTDIRTEVIRLPITSRPSSCDAKTQALSEFYTEALIASLEPLALGPLTQSLGWPALSVRQFADVVQKILRAIYDLHLYNNMRIITAKRPPAQR